MSERTGMMHIDRRPWIIGVTGGVGSGKSTVLSYLHEKYHAELLLCDLIACELQQPGGNCYEPMLRLFGKHVLCEDGMFDRKKIADLVFSDQQLLSRLNQIVHPAVKQCVCERIKELHGQTELIVIEAALLLEEGYDRMCDDVWFVEVNKEVRRMRLKCSRGYTDEKINGIMAAQKPDAFFREHCLFTVDNNKEDVQNTYKQIDERLALTFLKDRMPDNR